MPTLVDEYLKLLTSQYADKPKYIKTISLLLNMVEPVFNCGVYFDENFDLDESQGSQMDKLGEIVGADRRLKYDPTQGQYPLLPDRSYRNLLKATIAKNHWKGDITELKTLWKNIFGTGIIVQDNQDMTATIAVIGECDSLTLEMIKQGLIVPKVDGVGYNYIFSRKPVFGYDLDTDTIKGYDLAEWVTDQLPPAFSYDIDDAEKMLRGYDQGEFV